VTTADGAVTIVMYHFVRPASAAFPRLPALDADAFDAQLRHVARQYTVISLAEVVAAAESDRPLPDRAAVLTFDDGYREHYDHVFPRLSRQRMTATFFPIRSALVDRTLADVNKIQFVLASMDDVEPLVREVDAHADDPAACRARWWSPSRFDSASVTYVKRMLQHGLPAPIRTNLLDTLFARHVTRDAHTFADDLYMTPAQAREMAAAGLAFGAHADRHVPLTMLTDDEQAREIDGALSALDAIGVPRTRFAYAFAKGAYDATSVHLLRRRGCAAALTTRPAVAHAIRSELLELPRFDTNDLPCDV
jgi:peptidoglycan/xylan/chitin deacetylase (PgdA/CDA1 family)